MLPQQKNMVFVGCLKKRLSNGAAGWDVDICYNYLHIQLYSIHMFVYDQMGTGFHYHQPIVCV